jgi:hypothetical protein
VQTQPPAAVPVGTFRNAELGAHADVSLDESGAGKIVIGLAPPRRLEPALDSAGALVWRAGALTVRSEPGSGRPSLLVSLPGAHHVRFDPVADAPPDRGIIRGLGVG